MATLESTYLISAIILTVISGAVAGQSCPDGRNITQYTGEVSITDGGRTCQKWSKKKPHKHKFRTDDSFPLDASIEAAENYCRNVDGDSKPWCYTKDPNVRWQYCQESICGVEGAKCGGLVRDSEGEISSIDRNNDGYYDNNRDCLWVLKAPEGEILRATVVAMDIEETKNCTQDFLEVYEWSGSHGRYCGNSTPDITSESNWLFVRFRSVAVGVGKGFKIAFHSAGKATTTPSREATEGDPKTDEDTNEKRHLISVHPGGSTTPASSSTMPWSSSTTPTTPAWFARTSNPFVTFFSEWSPTTPTPTTQQTSYLTTSETVTEKPVIDRGIDKVVLQRVPGLESSINRTQPSAANISTTMPLYSTTTSPAGNPPHATKTTTSVQDQTEGFSTVSAYSSGAVADRRLTTLSITLTTALVTILMHLRM